MLVNEGASCNDGLSCTTATTCTAGSCNGSGANIYFFDDFSDNAAGWTLDPEWQIAPAMASVPILGGNPDPAQDHSISTDNGVAGTVIGGNIINSPHPMWYLTSPPFNTSSAPGSLYLSYQRWLNSDPLPDRGNQVEIFDGSGWVVVWQSGMMPIQDAAWSHQSHDISAYKSTATRVRFGFSVNTFNALPLSGWNLDDVLIADSPCN